MQFVGRAFKSQFFSVFSIRRGNFFVYFSFFSENEASIFGFGTAFPNLRNQCNLIKVGIQEQGGGEKSAKSGKESCGSGKGLFLW